MNTDVLTDTWTRFMAAVDCLQDEPTAQLDEAWNRLRFARYLAETGRISEEDSK